MPTSLKLKYKQNRRTKGAVARRLIAFVGILCVMVAILYCYEQHCMTEITELVEEIDYVAFNEGEPSAAHGRYLNVFKPHEYAADSYTKVYEFQPLCAFLFFNKGVVHAKCVLVHKLGGDECVHVTCWISIPVAKKEGRWFVSSPIKGFV